MQPREIHKEGRSSVANSTPDHLENFVKIIEKSQWQDKIRWNFCTEILKDCKDEASNFQWWINSNLQ